MDIAETTAPRSDQLNADDLMGGPETYTIAEVSRGSSEQPVNVQLVETPGRPWRPSKSMRRVLMAAWGRDTDSYAGRRVRLYRDPDVQFGGDVVGGIKISHLSDITDRMSISLTVKRGKRAPHVVEPLAAGVSAEEIAACTDLPQLRAMWSRADARGQALITARVAELSTAQQDEAAQS